MQLDAERLELGAVGVEAAREGVLVHAAVALDVAPDLQRGHRPPLGHEVRDQRQLADQLLGVLRHRRVTIRPSPMRWAAGCRRCRALSADSVAAVSETRRPRPSGRTSRGFAVYGSPLMTKLVIVDDHEALREGLVALLQHGGLEVVGAAGNVAAGVDLVEHAEPDVAIVDIQLPDGSGIDLTRELLARRPELGVILYTGDSDAELLYDGLDSGARGYALKAGSMDELMAAHRARRRRRLLRRPAAGPHPALAAGDGARAAALAARARDHAPPGRGPDRRGHRGPDQRVGRDRRAPTSATSSASCRRATACTRSPSPSSAERSPSTRRATSDDPPVVPGRTIPTSVSRGSCTTCARR